jgi:hypothetical protein
VVLAAPATARLALHVVDLGKVEEEDRRDIDKWRSGRVLVEALINVCTVLGDFCTDRKVPGPYIVDTNREDPPGRLWWEV